MKIHRLSHKFFVETSCIHEIFKRFIYDEFSLLKLL
jgi:hypothetical protein